MSTTSTARRHWLDFGAGEFLLLAVVLGFIWWQAVRAPVHATDAPAAGGPDAGQRAVDRPPTPNEVLARGSIASVVAVGGCIGGRWLIRRAARRE
jgi:hypothetical protein